MMLMKKGVLVSCMAVCFLLLLKSVQSAVPQQEVEAVEEILSSMGATNWRFNGEFCQLEAITQVQKLDQEALASVQCDGACNNLNSSNCHVISLTHKFYSLGGVLPPALVKLPYLQTIDFAYNYLNGTIPAEWAATRLQSISLLGNRLTGEIPRELANITTLTTLSLEGNQFSGEIPSDLGRLSRLETLILSSNRLMGTLPTSFSALRNLKDFRINDNNLSGPIPDLIQNWRQLTRLELIGTGLQGPIPSNISLLENLTELRISDLNGPTQEFPPLNNATGILRVLLRNCNISGEIPAYIWQRRDLVTLDVSFNQLVGEISSNIIGRSLRYVFLTGNMLSGNVPDTLLIEGATIDLSYNNFTWQGLDRPTCRPNMNLYLNLFRSSSTGKTLQDILPCETNIVCPKYECSLHVNSGGNDVWVRENNVEVLYEGDASFNGDTAGFYRGTSNWGISSTGDFLDDNIQTGHYIGSLEGSTNLPPLYTTARLSPLSLTYVSYCLENGNYLINLHFAEIQFTNDSTYRNLGRRLFDIYIQGKRVKRDFNIENEAHGIQKAVVIPFNASVVNNSLEIRLYWAGKGTMRIPRRGVYGPLISAISVNPYFKTCSIEGKKKSKVYYVIFGIMGPCLVLLILAALWWKGCLKFRKRKNRDLKGLELNTVSFSLKQLETATNNFNGTNKIGEGGFGPVYKGVLPNGTIVAVKQLSSHSRQGNREFLNEIGLISCLQHPNLVKLHGCCIEGDQLMLVYEYLENNNLANALFGAHNSRLTLDWPTRFKICVGIAKGLAFLHEESRLKIVHRDIKATNVLLDKDLNPKISDFGLARLYEDDKSHISTRVAGTIGYMAPEYALWGHLSEKADVYSFGVVVLEIVSGKNNNLYIPKNGSICLLDWACRLQTSKMYDELFDEKLGSHIIKEEAETVVKVALLCTDGSPSIRPTMSEVVSMLEGRTSVPEIVPRTTGYTEDLRFKAMRAFHERQSQTQFSNTNQASTHTFSTLPLTTGFEIQSDERLSDSQSQYSNISRTECHHSTPYFDNHINIHPVHSRSD